MQPGKGPVWWTGSSYCNGVANETHCMANIVLPGTGKQLPSKHVVTCRCMQSLLYSMKQL